MCVCVGGSPLVQANGLPEVKQHVYMGDPISPISIFGPLGFERPRYIQEEGFGNTKGARTRLMTEK